MKMPKRIAVYMLAACGMNCAVCYKHIYTKTPAGKPKETCPGCREEPSSSGEESSGKPNHCRQCKIKSCAEEKELQFCSACPEFPCKWIKDMDNSYRKRYQVSLIENSIQAKTSGIEHFFESERERWLCADCGGVFSLHDRVCSECGRAMAQGKQDTSIEKQG